jgi:hemolysin activation/secretion protein
MDCRFLSNKRKIRAALVALATSVLAGQVVAQQAPDAGQILESLKPTPVPAPEGKSVEIPPLSPSGLLPGGQTVTLKTIAFKGIVSIPENEVRSHLGTDVLNTPLDLAGLRGIADKVSLYLRGRGFPFARAVLPPQNLASGELIVEVYEGFYGQARATSPDARLAAAAQLFLNGLPGKVIDASRLERVTLLIDDLPGVSVSPIIRPGVNTGEGDLQIEVTQTEKYGGSLSLDNHGSRFSGAWRGQGSFQINAAATPGDQVSITAMLSNEDLRLGGLGYSLPLGGDGWRAQANYSAVKYQLGAGFEGFEGTAKVSSLGLSYPLIRSRVSNLTASLSYQYKDLEDQRLGEPAEKKTAKVTPLVLSFDRRDSLAGGGITYGAVTVSNGSITELGVDKNFTRWNLDMSRLQSINPRWTVMGRVIGQRANTNLDSSEGLSLGGAQGVRAYPNGEGSGDEGWLIQLEARASLGVFSPYGFYDHGKVQVDAKPELNPGPRAPDVERSGLGLGVRFAFAGWSLDTAVAWRATSDKPTSDTRQESKPRVWAQARYGF